MPREYIPVAPPVGDADASDVLDGATFSGENAGINVTGTMPNNGAGDITGPNDALSGSGYYSSITNSIPDRGSLTVDPQASSQSFASGYYDTVDVNGDGSLTPSNVRDGVTIFGTTGSYLTTYTTDIQLNGTQEGSFSQQSDSTYNVDASGVATGTTTTVVHSMSCGQDQEGDGGGSLPPAFMIKNQEVTLRAINDFEGAATASADGSSVSSAGDDTQTQTITVSSGVNGYSLEVFTQNVGGASASAEVEYEMYTDLGVTTNNVSQS